ncbi:hypothetical protein SAMN05216337_101786 [Bradyrhizobium brasilense]|uniref:Uncharacterized protein n=1 Tax=Bradyrhizobium brasilense TaxID=1419277 RepID=A0A1G6YVD4_9BRAD|nr:hypothetical protein [Bradyrhizobium brasilense]SDD93546.1 hypothetical protein SAMN05216337_101786 [Bradyrhizobium brasilense]
MNNVIKIGRFEYRRPTAPPPEPTVVFTKVFDGKKGMDFSALNDAETYLKDRGFSVGPGCAASGKSGIVYGRCWRIAKWRNLTPLEQRQCHGVIEGDRRNGPVTIKIFFHAPAFAIAAVSDPEVAGAIVTAWSEQR